MTTRLTLFTATLVQDSALSVSGLDRESSSDQPFAIVNGAPTLVGRGLKGAAVAMAKRFFDPLPRAISDDVQHGALRRSVWEFADATTEATPRLRAGVGIRHKTGARASRLLYDREVIPAGTRWQLAIRVDRSYAVNDDEFTEAEGILGYVLEKHWKEGRCWLGGGVARGLGWCHIEQLLAYRLTAEDYDRWVESGRQQLPTPLDAIPTVAPTRSWCFRTLDIHISFGEYKPDPNEAAWGLDMLAIGTHDADRVFQPAGDGEWAKPTWAINTETPAELSTDRALLMDGARPLLPGSSFRGPLRHAYSRAERAAGREVNDPHLFQGDVGDDDPAGQVFGTTNKSSRVLIRDARAEAGWAAVRLHMHAEDEFSAGSYGSAKRNAARLLKGVFPVRIIVEGATPDQVEPLVKLIDQQVALGALGHLPIGGHKTRGAGWGHWQVQPWRVDDVQKVRDWTPPKEPETTPTIQTASPSGFIQRPAPTLARVRIAHGTLNATLTLAEAAWQAQSMFGNHALVAWWCDPSIDLSRTTPPATFGDGWPLHSDLLVDEVAFYAGRAVWRAVRTTNGVRYVFIEEVGANETGDAREARVVFAPAQLHDFQRFSAARTGRGQVLLREWYIGNEMLGFTISEVRKP